MNLRLQSNRLEVERGIAPPMKLAITLPVILDEANAGVVVYVCVSPFSSRPANKEQLTAIATELAQRINARQTEPADCINYEQAAGRCRREPAGRTACDGVGPEKSSPGAGK